MRTYVLVCDVLIICSRLVKVWPVFVKKKMICASTKRDGAGYASTTTATTAMIVIKSNNAHFSAPVLY